MQNEVEAIKRIWSEDGKRAILDEDARSILGNVRGFFDVLHAWREEERRINDRPFLETPPNNQEGDSSMEEFDLMTPEEAAARLRLKVRTLASWRSKRNVALPFIKLNGAIRYRRADVEAFIDQGLRVVAGQEGAQ